MLGSMILELGAAVFNDAADKLNVTNCKLVTALSKQRVCVLHRCGVRVGSRSEFLVKLQPRFAVGMRMVSGKHLIQRCT